MTEQLPAKVLLKIGNIEMQYEGNENFLKAELPSLFQELLNIYRSSSKNGEFEQPGLSAPTENPIPEIPSNKISAFDVNSIGEKLGIAEPKDLAWAACAYLALVKQKVPFSRDDIRDAMKTGDAYYTESHRKTLSHYIESLVNDGFLLVRSPHTYGIDGNKLKELRKSLAS